MNSGSGSGSDKHGDNVTIIADKPQKDYKFKHWTGDTIYIIKQNKDTALVLMPTKDISLTAEYELKSGVEDFGISEFTISPNPASDILIINGDLINATIEIYNIFGEKVKSVTNLNYINISDLSSGVYFIKIDSKNYKFIKY